MPKNMSLNAVIANIYAHAAGVSEITFTPEDFARVQANAVSPQKIAVLDAYENGEPLPELATPVLPERKAAPVAKSATVSAPSVNAHGTRSKLGRTREQIDLAGEFFEAAKLGTLVAVGDKVRVGSKAAKARKVTYEEACTLAGIPTAKNGLVNA